MADFGTLFSPVELGPVTIMNRIQVTPHELQYFRDGLITDAVVDYYAERAKGGAGLLEVSQLMVKNSSGVILPDWQHDSSRRFPLANVPELVPGLRRLSDTVHAHGSKIFMEVSAWSSLYGQVSMLPFENGAQLRELSVSDVREIQEAFCVASKYVKEGGFDGIDLHGTHGALLEQFYSPAFNRRTDQYGGSLENRMRMVLELEGMLRGVVGDKMAVGMRLCADERIEGGVSPEYASRMTELFDGRLDFVNVDSGSTGNFEAANQKALQTEPLYAEHGYGVYMSEAVKRVAKKTKVGVVGRIGDPLLAEHILDRGAADYVGMTRALIADPELPRKAREGRMEDIRPCIGTLQDCWGRSVSRDWPMRCTVNPSVGMERERGSDSLRKATTSKKILVVGAGPAGLEFSRVASERGHDVVIYEADDSVGGQVRLAACLPGRSDIGAILKWYEVQLKKRKVRLELNKEVPPDEEGVERLLAQERPDVVVLATGSLPIRNGIQMATFREVQGWDSPIVHTLDEALGGRVNSGDRVVVADSTTYIHGPGVAEWLSRSGARVVLVTPHSRIAPDLFNYNQSVHVMRRLRSSEVRIVTFGWVRRIEDRAVTIFDIPTGSEETIEADRVVLNTGRRQNDSLRRLLVGKTKEFYEIGDCDVAGGLMRSAIDAGYGLGSKL